MRTADYWIKNLELKAHPEGGYYKETYRSPDLLPAGIVNKKYESERNCSTSIFYLLKSGQISTFHRLKSDEIVHFYYGSYMMYYIINENGDLQKIKLGSNPENGEALQALMRGGSWFASYVESPKSFALIGCTVSPGFDFRDFEISDRAKMLALFPNHKDIIVKFTK